MKLDEQNRQIITNTDNSHEFTIQNNAKMFQILSDKIYTYKIAAIVREISCNAYDSHVEAGIPDVPFRVVLPNDLHEYFEIEDFGLGLNEQEVYEIYTSYGASTKTESNDVIGAFGLGSKTPFAYTTSFTIQTRKDGVEYLFNAYIGNNGAPTCSLLRKRDTTESNGVKIKVPVKYYQKERFRSECQFILSFFPVRPDVVGSDLFNFNFDEETVESIRSGRVTVVKSNHVMSELYQNKRLYAMMGTVCYPINMQDIISTVDEKLYKYLNDVVLEGRPDTAVFLKFDIGELDVNAAREGLSIEEGKKTQKNLGLKFTEKLKELIEEDEEQINECEHPNHTIAYLNNKYGYVINFVRNLFEYRGQNLANIASRRMRSSYGEHIFHKQYSRYSWDNKQVTRAKAKTAQEFATGGYIILTSRNPKTRGFIKYGRELAKDYPGVIIVSSDNKPWSQHKIDRYAKYIGFEPKEVIYLEDLKADDQPVYSNAVLAKPSKPPKKKTEVTARSFLITKNGATYIQSERIDVDHLREHGYTVLYTEPNHYDDKEIVKYKYHDKYISMGLSLYDKLWTLYDTPIRIILSNNINRKSIDKNDVQSLSDFMTEFTDEHKDLIETAAKLTMNFDKVLENVYFSGSTVIQYAIWADSPAVDKELYDLYDQAEQNTQFLQGHYVGSIYANMLGYSPNDYILDHSDTEHNLKQSYPMLKYINTYGRYDDEQKNHAIEYMKILDGQIQPKIKKIA